MENLIPPILVVPGGTNGVASKIYPIPNTSKSGPKFALARYKIQSQKLVKNFFAKPLDKLKEVE